MLEWNFKKDFIGKLTFKDVKQERTFTCNLYKDGRAVVGCFEYYENGNKYYQVQLFWLDEKHLTNCLKDNVYNAVEVVFNQKWFEDMKPYSSRYVRAFIDAKINISITTKKISKKYYEKVSE